jgi:hypothetical protein
MPLGNSRMSYQVTTYPVLLPAAPLLPPNCLVTYSSLVPGLQRFDEAGFLSVMGKSITSTLARPLLAPTFAVALYNIAVTLPAGFQEVLPTLERTSDNIQSHPPQISEYTIRLCAHNGRTFVGPEVSTSNINVVKLPAGGFVLEVDGAIELDWLPGDINVVVIAELIFTGVYIVFSLFAPIGPFVFFCGSVHVVFSV